jgi:exopolysaccharide biosynthesis polyprenyl glycosylphosphotransferase
MTLAREATGTRPEEFGRDLYPALKRVFDVTVALVLLVCLVPVLTLCAVLVLLDSRGPILYRQERVGQNGKRFTLLKFRSMRTDADPALHREYVTSYIRGQAARATDGGRQIFKLVQDPRVTRVGRWLRRTSMDELPQLWNVVRGDMSLVGPRPPIPYELDLYAPAHRARLNAKPGITGLWQVSGRNGTTFEDMVEMDLRYIQEASLMLDLEILVKTIPVVFGRQGA